MDIAGLGWQILVATLFIPLVIYGYLVRGQSFPLTERVEMGVSTADALNSSVYRFRFATITPLPHRHYNFRRLSCQ